MKNIKIYITILILLIISQNVLAYEYLKPINKNANFKEIINESENNQKFISEYIKKHTKEQNLELFLAWEDIMTPIINNVNNSMNFNTKPDENYLKNLQAQFSKTGIFPYYTNNQYGFSINYSKEYNTFGKYIPNDWSLYLKNLKSPTRIENIIKE